MLDADHTEIHRPLGLNLLAGLYLFFFLLSASTFGNPFPCLGKIHVGTTAKILVFIDSLVCLYLFLGIMKRQALTWYLLLAYNFFEVLNIIVNLNFVTRNELERVMGTQVNPDSLTVNNIAAALAILLLSQFIYRNKHYFSNRRKYLF
jgi:hypothetical protein